MNKPGLPLRRPTMTDVAAAAGVSLKTVSRVINGVQSVDEQLAARVRAAEKELGFRANFAASSLRAGTSTRTIGLLIKDLSNEYYGTIAAAVTAVAKSHGTQVITTVSGEDPAGEMDAINDLCQRRVDGLIIVPTNGDHSSLQTEIDLGIPMVFIDRRPNNLAADAVVLDDYAGSYAATRQLIEAGHVRISVLVDTLNMDTMRLRLDGFRAALADGGLELDELLVGHDIHGPDEGAAFTRSMLGLSDAPTAFFCGNNRSAIGALATLWERQSNAALVCFDDFRLSDLMPRPITIIKYDTHLLGTSAANLLFRRIDGEVFSPETVVVPTQIVERGISADGHRNHPQGKQ